MGEACMTPGGSLPFKNIIHVAVPLSKLKDEKTKELLLGSCVINTLEVAK